MLDHTLRIQRLGQEAADPAVAIILLDVVLGYGAHPNPAVELGPAIAAAKEKAAAAGRHLDVVAVVVGTDEDPQDLAAQIEQLEAAGAKVELSHRAAIDYTGERLQLLNGASQPTPVDLTMFNQPLNAINVGLEIFAESITAQGGSVVHVDWRPPAGGNEKLMGILARMKG
jgi:FdrA protein